MVDEYQKQLLGLIKQYDPEEYNELINGDKVAVENYLDHLANEFPTLESFEEAMKKTAKELEK